MRNAYSEAKSCFFEHNLWSSGKIYYFLGFAICTLEHICSQNIFGSDLEFKYFHRLFLWKSKWCLLFPPKKKKEMASSIVLLSCLKNEDVIGHF